MAKGFFFVLALSLMVGCAGNRAITGLETPIAASGASRVTVPMLVATVRKRSDNPSLAYSSQRSDVLNFSSVVVRVPDMHRPGRVETASNKPDPRRDFIATDYKFLSSNQAMSAELERRLTQRSGAQREVLVFVHGYNNNFAEGLFRNAQIIHDYGIAGLPVHFSWASAASFTRYLYDRDSAIIARNGLAETLKVAAGSQANGIMLVGHSMGAVVVMEALRTLSAEKRWDVLKRINGVLLAAPDLDPDLFRSQIADIEHLPQPFTIVVSRRDRALDLSRRLAGGAPRVGSGYDIALLQNKNIQVFDVSQIDNGGHSLFASSGTLIKFLGNGHLLRRLVTDEYAGLDDTFVAAGQGTLEQASLAVHLPARIIDRLAER